MRSDLGRAVFVCLLAILAAMPACGDSDDDGGSCTEGNEKCSGTTVLQCNSGKWTTKKDCTETGRTCAQVSATDADCQ